MYNYPQSGYFNREDDDAVSATQTVDIHAAGIVGILSAPQEDATMRLLLSNQTYGFVWK